MQFTVFGKTIFDGSEIPNQSSVALTPGAVVAANLDGANTLTLVPAQNCTINASGGINNQEVAVVITTSGASSFNVTFGTNFKSQGVLATGTVSAKVFILQFKNINGTWHEFSRSGAM